MKTLRTSIASIISDQTLGKGIAKEYAREVAAYLLAERRVGELDSLLRDVQADWAGKGYVEVLARSAHPLSDDAKYTISEQVRKLYPSAKKIIVSELADPSVIGGVQIRLADKQLDLSVEAKLNKFKQLTGAGKE